MSPWDRPVKLLMTSVDVLHCLFIPAFRIKEDCVPGMTTHLWFTANEPGTYDIFCTEYCGVGHSHMRSKVVVMTTGGFRGNGKRRAGENRRRRGAAVAPGQGVSGMPLPGRRPEGRADLQRPSGPEGDGYHRGARKRRSPWTAAFIREHILQPQSATVKGFPPVMPVIPMTEEELTTIVSYLETVK